MPEQSVAAPFAASDVADAAGAQPTSPEPAAQAPVPEANVAVPELPRIGSIAVVPEPVCDFRPRVSDAEHLKFLKKPAVQRAVYAIGAAVAAHSDAYISTLLDAKERRLIVVLHTDFRDYPALQKQLSSTVSGVSVELSPACRPRAELAHAERVLQARAFHPKARETSMGFYLEGATSAYNVTIDESAPEVAEALKQALGPLVRVSLGRPARHVGVKDAR